jgi:magnesium chelatase subunit D
MSSPSSARLPVIYPLAALVGQERMKLALLLNAVNPRIGGVLIRGEKGTAKSTAARGLAALLPHIEGNPRCSYRCGPDSREACSSCRRANGSRVFARMRPAFVTLPLGATEDCLIGSIDFEQAIRVGKARFRPGLLAKANRGVMYVDEVNLLDDHLVDGLLDAAETGINRVEREGISIVHPARFLLIGTMNPEEGELRPQLLDRFPLAVEIRAEQEPSTRVKLLRRRDRFDRDPACFTAEYADASNELSLRIQSAKAELGKCTIPRPVRGFIAELCTRNHVAGHRADLAIERAAVALAAWSGHHQVTADDVLEVAPMALLHRMRTGQPPDFPPPPPREDESDKPDEPEARPKSRASGAEAEAEPEPEPGQEESSNAEPEAKNCPTQGNGSDDDRPPPQPGPEAEEDNGQGEASQRASAEQRHSVGATFSVRPLVPAQDRQLRTGSGRRTRSLSATKQGRYVRSTPHRTRDDLALDATLRAAAPHQILRSAHGPGALAIRIEDCDVREKIRERRVGAHILFIVDASGSMGAQRRMVETKAAIMSLLLDAYQKRDKVALIVFRQRAAELALTFTSSVEQAARLLADLPVGGRTPLSAALVCAAEVLGRLLRKESAAQPLVLLLTDGRANCGLGAEPPHRETLVFGRALVERFPRARYVVVDTEPQNAVRLQLAKRLAGTMGADYFHTEDLRAEQLVHLARQ